MTEIITYRLSETGRWGYEFYDAGRNRIGSVNAVIATSSPVLIEGKDLYWYSQFGIDNMIVPGTSRRVKDNQTGLEVFRIVFWQPGKYEVRTAEASDYAEIREGIYLFGRPLMPVTAMTERITGAEWIPPKNMNVEPYFKTTFFENVNDAYLMMVLSFPALRFY
jgi:hypothetical protein